MGKCASDVSVCLQAGTSLCDCEADLVACYSALGCGSQVLAGVTKACESAGCSASQCAPTRRLAELAIPQL